MTCLFALGVGGAGCSRPPTPDASTPASESRGGGRHPLAFVDEHPPGGDAHPLVGTPAPAFAAASVNGKGEVALKPGAGRVVIVHFWATWCEPCQRSMPALEEIYAKFKSAGLDVIAVDEDDDNNQRVAEFGARFGASLPMAWDEDRKIAVNWMPKAMPCTFIVDRQGIVRFAHLGYYDDVWAWVERELFSLL
jgi:thiol-disulfide isomerase/thioredoxin